MKKPKSSGSKKNEGKHILHQSTVAPAGGVNGEPSKKPGKIVVQKWYYYPGLDKMTNSLENWIKW